IVRGVVWQITDTKDQRAIYSALEAHFEPMATPGYLEVQSLADLTPAIERYFTLVGLKRYDDAIKLFYEKLDSATHYRLAAYGERIAWLEQLFCDAEGNLPTLSDESAQSFTLNALAQSYLFSGQPSKSVLFYQQASEIDRRLGLTKNQ